MCTHTHTSPIPTSPKAEAKHLFFCHCPVREREQEDLSQNQTFIKFQKSHAKDWIQDEMNTKRGRNTCIHLKIYISCLTSSSPIKNLKNKQQKTKSSSTPIPPVYTGYRRKAGKIYYTPIWTSALYLIFRSQKKTLGLK